MFGLSVTEFISVNKTEETYRMALSFDFLAIAMAELGNISERRVAQLIMGVRGLPEMCIRDRLCWDAIVTM